MLSVSPSSSSDEQRERDRQRQRQQDRDRVQEALELRREHHVHEEEAEARRRGAKLRVALGERLGAAAPTGCGRAAAGRAPSATLLGVRRRRSPSGSAGQQVGDDGDRALAVEAVDLRRADVLAQADEVGEAHELPVARRARSGRRWRAASAGVPGLGAQPDVVLLVGLLELGDRLAADERLQRRRDVLHVDARGRTPSRGRSSSRSSGLRTESVVSTSTSPGSCAHARHQPVGVAPAGARGRARAG